MTRTARGMRLVPIAATAWGSAALVTMVPTTAPAIIAITWFATALLVSALARRGVRVKGAGAVVVLSLAAAAVVSSHVGLAQPQRASAIELSVTGGRALAVDALVVGKIERRADGSAVFDAIATRLAAGADTVEVWIEVSVRLDSEQVSAAVGLDAGASVEVHGTARAADLGERAVLDITASRGLLVVRPPQGIFDITSRLRHALVDSAAALPGSGAQLIPGLAVGDTVLVGAELDADMKTSSLSHLTAVSGANCALVVGIAFALAAVAGASRAVRVVAGALTLMGFIVLVTPEPSVVRAGAMASIALLALLCGRSGAGLATLALAVTLLMVIDPWLSTSLGFALSAAATGALLVLARPLAAGLGRWMPRALALTIAVPLSAQLACGPLLVLIEPSVPVYGVLANILAAPAAPAATVLGLAACLAPWAPWLQDGLVAITWIPASWIAGTAQLAAGLPGGTVAWIEGWVGAALLTLIGVMVVAALRGAGGGRVARAAGRASALALSVLVGMAAGAAVLDSAAGSWTVPRDWTVLMCDVGQGDAILVRSAGAVVLIDTGPEPASLERCLHRAGVDHIDVAVLTHFDLDHAGGAEALLGRAGTILHGPTTPEGDALLSRARASGTQAHSVRAGAEGAFGDARWRVLWPGGAGGWTTPGNDASVVVEFTGLATGSLLLLGDLSEGPQCAILAQGGLRPRYDVVKVAHHGSADQCDSLYDAASPAVALIPVGADNTYGHPRQEILDVLASTGARAVRTDEDGMVALIARHGALQIWREHR